MTNWTKKREAAALCAIDTRAALVTLPQIEQDLFDAIHESQRLRKELIEVWPHRALRCPCAERGPVQYRNSAPWQDCTCGLNEALYGCKEGENK